MFKCCLSISLLKPGYVELEIAVTSSYTRTKFNFSSSLLFTNEKRIFEMKLNLQND